MLEKFKKFKKNELTKETLKSVRGGLADADWCRNCRLGIGYGGLGIPQQVCESTYGCYYGVD